MAAVALSGTTIRLAAENIDLDSLLSEINRHEQQQDGSTSAETRHERSTLIEDLVSRLGVRGLARTLRRCGQNVVSDFLDASVDTQAEIRTIRRWITLKSIFNRNQNKDVMDSLIQCCKSGDDEPFSQILYSLDKFTNPTEKKDVIDFLLHHCQSRAEGTLRKQIVDRYTFLVEHVEADPLGVLVQPTRMDRFTQFERDLRSGTFQKDVVDFLSGATNNHGFKITWDLDVTAEVVPQEASDDQPQSNQSDDEDEDDTARLFPIEE